MVRPAEERPGAKVADAAPLTSAPLGEPLSPMRLDSRSLSVVEVQLLSTLDTFAAARDLIHSTPNLR